MQAQRERIEAAGATVIFVAFDEADTLRTVLLAGLEPVFPVTVDRDRVAYRAWGLERAPWWKIFLDPAVGWRYARLIMSGERIRGRGEDSLQLGGDFVVAPDGTIAYARPQRRDDRPPVGELLAALERLEFDGS